jgi:anthranilate synthase component 1
MISPSINDFKKLSSNGNTIPIYKRLTNDTLTPISCYLKLTAQTKEFSFLFESILGGEKIGRYSFVGAGKRSLSKAHARF